MMDYSDKMWENAKKTMHFMLHRGGKAIDISPVLNLKGKQRPRGQSQKCKQTNLSGISAGDTRSEVEALAGTLDIIKTQAENTFDVHKHANNKHKHQNDPTLDSYDPMVK